MKSKQASKRDRTLLTTVKEDLGSLIEDLIEAF
jgi:hypothetical protein